MGEGQRGEAAGRSGKASSEECKAMRASMPCSLFAYLDDQLHAIASIFCVWHAAAEPPGGKHALQVCLHLLERVGKVGPRGQRVICDALKIF